MVWFKFIFHIKFIIIYYILNLLLRKNEPNYGLVLLILDNIFFLFLFIVH